MDWTDLRFWFGTLREWVSWEKTTETRGWVGIGNQRSRDSYQIAKLKERI